MLIPKDPLAASIDRLNAALAEDPHDDEQGWLAWLRAALANVEQALGRHPPPTAKNVSSHVELQRREISPTIARGTHDLRQDQQAMLEEIDALIGHLRRDDAGADVVSSYRQIGAELVKKLQNFCSAENKIIFDNVMRDTGAGD